MCGIALIVSGIRLDLSSLHVDARSPFPHPVHEQVSILGLAIFFLFGNNLDIFLLREFELGAQHFLCGSGLILISFSCSSLSFR